MEFTMSSWSFDTSHSEVGFSVSHMVFARVRGTFPRWSGTVAADDAGVITGVSAGIEVESIDTHEAQRDGHLRSADFFDAANHPKMTFVSTGVRGDTATSFLLDGTLTIRGTTRPATLDVTFTGGGKDPWGNTRRGYRATTRINRRDFGLNWNQALELGGVLVGEVVEIQIETELVKQA